MAVIYVDSSASTGGDGSFATPYDSTADLTTSTVSSGDTIILTGSFTARIQLTGLDNITITSSDPSSPANITAAGSQCIRLNNCDGWLVDSVSMTDSAYGVYLENACNNNTFRNCTLSGHTQEAIGCNAANASGTGNLFTGLTITAAESSPLSNDGVSARGSIEFDVEDCVISGFDDGVGGGDGVSAHNTSRINIRGCEIFDCNDGVHHVSNTGDFLIERTYIHSVTGDCINFTPAAVQTDFPNLTVRDCVLMATGTNSLDAGIRVSEVSLNAYNNFIKTVNTGSNNTYGVGVYGSPADGIYSINIRNCVFDGSDDVNARYVGLNSTNYGFNWEHVSFKTPASGTETRFMVGGSGVAYAAFVSTVGVAEDGIEFLSDLGLTGDPASAAENAKPTAASPLSGSGTTLSTGGTFPWRKDYAGSTRNASTQWARGPFLVHGVVPFSESGSPKDVDKGLPTSPKASRVVSVGRYPTPIDLSIGQGSTVDIGRLGGGSTVVLSSATAGQVRVVFGHAGTAPTAPSSTLTSQDDGSTLVTFTGAGMAPVAFTAGRRITHITAVASTEMELAISVY